MGLSRYRLAKEIGVPAQRISEIVAGKRSVTADTDLRLCRFFGLSNGYWLRAQAAHDTEVAERTLGPSLKKIKPWQTVAAQHDIGGGANNLAVFVGNTRCAPINFTFDEGKSMLTRRDFIKAIGSGGGRMELSGCASIRGESHYDRAVKRTWMADSIYVHANIRIMQMSCLLTWQCCRYIVGYTCCNRFYGFYVS